MSETKLKIKCINCGSDDTFVYLGNPDPNKVAFRCRKCSASWNNL